LNDFITLTAAFSTALSAQKLLEQIVEIQCTLAKSTDYGISMIDMSLLRVANTPNTQFLAQAELMAIMQGFHYTENSMYKGYIN
jgi:lipopolysaccharide biosynthesis protein